MTTATLSQIATALQNLGTLVAAHAEDGAPAYEVFANCAAEEARRLRSLDQFGTAGMIDRLSSIGHRALSEGR